MTSHKLTIDIVELYTEFTNKYMEHMYEHNDTIIYFNKFDIKVYGGKHRWSKILFVNTLYELNDNNNIMFNRNKKNRKFNPYIVLVEIIMDIIGKNVCNLLMNSSETLPDKIELIANSNLEITTLLYVSEGWNKVSSDKMQIISNNLFGLISNGTFSNEEFIKNFLHMSNTFVNYIYKNLFLYNEKISPNTNLINFICEILQ